MNGALEVIGGIVSIMVTIIVVCCIVIAIVLLCLWPLLLMFTPLDDVLAIAVLFGWWVLIARS